MSRRCLGLNLLAATVVLIGNKLQGLQLLVDCVATLEGRERVVMIEQIRKRHHEENPLAHCICLVREQREAVGLGDVDMETAACHCGNAVKKVLQCEERVAGKRSSQRFVFLHSSEQFCELCLGVAHSLENGALCFVALKLFKCGNHELRGNVWDWEIRGYIAFI